MLQTVDLLRRVLVPFLVTGASLLGALFAYLFIQRAVREVRWRRRQAVITRCRPMIEALTQFGPTPQTLADLRVAAASHRRIVAGLLLAPLHAARGEIVSHVRAGAAASGVIDDWRADLQDRRWWLRADGVRALGFVEERSALPAILAALDDEHEEVRAAAVDAAGRVGDPRAIPALIGHLADDSRYQRARMVEALRSLGPAVTPALVELAGAHPEHAQLAAEILGLIGTATAIEPLLAWCGDPRGDVRAAALAALGTIGLDDRSHYFALRALGDADPNARAMAARALGRGRRDDAVSYLAERLDDDWLPAAQAAGALRQLGEAGRAALEARAGETGQAGDLARQMLWSR